jgi:hypothetical protein
MDVDSGIALSHGTGETIRFGCNRVDVVSLYLFRNDNALLAAGKSHGHFSVFLVGASNARLPIDLSGKFRDRGVPVDLSTLT